MSHGYQRPYHQRPPVPHSQPSYAAYSPAVAPATLLPANEPKPEPHRVLFAGLPENVTASDLRDLLLSDLHLSPLTTSVTSLHDGQGEFQGVMLVYVGSSQDAEKIRAQYSNQFIDNEKFILQVHHVLPSYVALPLQSNPRPNVIAQPQPQPAPTYAANAPADRYPPRGTKAPALAASVAGPARGGHQVAKGNAPKGNSQAQKAPGLSLLHRLDGGKGKGQVVNAKKQKAAAQNKSSGASLLARMNSTTTSASASKKNKPKASNGQSKVKRAKGKGQAMEIDV